jgi:CubicO group peptidase (beta-lactamase class C family)
MKILVTLLALNSVTSFVANCQILSPIQKAKLDSLFTIIDKNDKGMGGVSIFREGKEIYSKYYGFASLPDNLKASNETRYRIGSMTKMFTAVIILKQIEDKKLSLQSKVRDFFPEIIKAGDITIEILLKHRSGIANFTDLPQYPEWQANTFSEQEWVGKIISIPVNFEPNEKFEYSNTNFLILSLIAQKIDNLSFENLIKKYISIPANLKNTYISKNINVNNSEALSYIKMVKWELSPETNPMLTLGAGAISSTAYDVNEFFSKLFEGKLISKNSLSLIIDFKDGHSLGFQEFLHKDLQGIGHGGKVDGFNCYGSYFPDKKTSVVFTSNAILYPMYDIWKGIMNILFEYPYQLPVFKVLDNKTLDTYTGVYTNENFPFKFHVIAENNMLIMEGGGQKFALEYDKENMFKLDMIGLVLEFLPNEGKMIFKQSGGVFEFKKE